MRRHAIYLLKIKPGEEKFRYIFKNSQNELWREDGVKMRVCILVTKTYYWNIQKTGNGHKKKKTNKQTNKQTN